MEPHDHLPVLFAETIGFLDPQPNQTFIDTTIGLAGHAARILELTAPSGCLLGIDADGTAIDSARVRLEPFAGRVDLVNSYFDDLSTVAAESGFQDVDGIVFDLGVSSPQLDQAERGFSFSRSGPLDMRMGRGARTTAAELLASASGDQLTRIFRDFGEERYAARISRRIVAERRIVPLTTTDQLAELVARTVPRQATSRIHPATRVFQALRIAVNDELGRLEAALPQATSLLRKGGRVAVISFHSLEDRIVKRFFQAEARGCVCPPDAPVCFCGRSPSLKILTRRPIRPSEAEIVSNPRSRSARLRVAEAI
jgi:16S rRNA (cytosine1402-N4)-methyltransferase